MLFLNFPKKISCHNGELLRRQIPSWKGLAQLLQEGHAQCVEHLMAGRRWERWENGQGDHSLWSIGLPNSNSIQFGNFSEAETLGKLACLFPAFHFK